MRRNKTRETDSLIEAERRVRKEFGKSFDFPMAKKRMPVIEAFWSKFDLDNKSFLDVGSGHPIIPAILTTMNPTVHFDCVDISPDFEEEASACVRAFGGDADRLRLITADFYDIGELSERKILQNRYDYILLAESLHHSLRKMELLTILVALMDESSKMILIEPVLPIFGRRKAYLESADAREMGYIEQPVSMTQYMSAIRSAGLKTVFMDYDTSREDLAPSLKRRMTPKFLYRLYRRRIRPMYALTNFIFVCRLDR
jgi:SAM-dependent methyltransferase